jgi:hypothetical protein
MGQLQFVKIGAAHFHFMSGNGHRPFRMGQLQFVKIGAAHFHFMSFKRPPAALDGPASPVCLSPLILVPLHIFLFSKVNL